MIIEDHDVETASQMVDAMQSSRVGAAYLALTVFLRQKANVAQVLRSVTTPRDETPKQ